MEWEERLRSCRPWLHLYEYNLPTQPRAELYPSQFKKDENLQPIPFNFWLLPTEVMDKILSLLDAEQLSSLAMTSKLWRSLVYNPSLWRNLAVNKLWPKESRKELERKVVFKYKTWRYLVIFRPHLRLSGVYIMRCQFSKTTTSRVVSDAPVAPVSLVIFHRILRFYTDGTVVALTTAESLDKAIQRVKKSWKPLPHQVNKVMPLLGEYEFDERSSTVDIKLPMVSKQYPNMRQGTAFYRLQLSSSRPGTFDTLHLVSHSGITDHDNGEIVIFDNNFGSERFKFVSKFGFKSKVLRVFPKVETSLSRWSEYAMAK